MSHHQAAKQFFAGESEIAVLMRSHDWAQTPLGAIETWSEDLKTAVQRRLTELNQTQTPQGQQESTPSPNCTQTALRPTAEADAFRVTLSDALRPLTDANEIQATAARILGESLGASRVIYLEVLPGGDEVIVHRNYTNGVAELTGRYRLEDFGRNLSEDHRAGRSVIIPDVANSLKYTESNKASYQALDIAAHLDVPLIKNDQFVAVLAVHQATAREWTDFEVKRVEETAERTWAAVERARAEAALRENEARLRLALKTGRLGSWQLDLKTNQLFTSDQCKANYGFVPEADFTHQALFDRIHPDDRAWVQAAVQQAIKQHTDYEAEYRTVWDDNSIHWAFVRGSTVYDADGTPLQMVGMSLDITDRKQTEAALQEQTNLLQLLIDSIGDGLILANPQGEFLLTNQAAERIFGQLTNERSCEEWSQTYGLHLPDQQTLFPDQQLPLYRAMQGESMIDVEVFVRRDPAIAGRWVSISGFPVRDTSGDITGGVITCRDVTDRKLTEAALRESEELKQSILDSSKDCIKVLTLSSEIVYMSRGGFCLLEVDDPTCVLNAYWIDFWQGEDYESAKSAIAAAKAGGTGQCQGYLSTYKGTPKWWDTIITPVRNSAGQIIQLVAISRDITRQKQAETEREQLLAQEQAAREAAETANRIKDEFLAVLSHELRSPLNPILGWSQLLQQGKLDATKTAAALTTIERNAKLQVQLIDDLLDISRILRGKLSLTMMSVDLQSVILAALETVRLAAQAKRIQIYTTALPGVGIVTGDAGRLQQAVWNLLSNAVKFTPANGQVTVTLRAIDYQAQIQVSDTGKGINSDFLPYVFEHFRQEDGATTRKFGGLGLGLAIARQIVELHGGTIVVDSPGEEQGATFTVQIPLTERSSVLPASNPPFCSIEDLTGVRILVVDDETDSREFVAFVLEQAGAIVTAVPSGIVALEAFPQAVPDIIVSDIGMPQMDGYMLMRHLRARPESKQIPAIALTAYAGEIDQQQAIAAGFQKHLSKPVEPEEVVRVIHALYNLEGTL